MNTTTLAKTCFKFGRLKRILKRPHFLYVQGSNKKWVGRNFITFVKDGRGPTSRFGVTVSRKVHNRAVRRNIIKRRLREILRLNAHRIPGCFDIVVVARQNATSATYSEIEKELIYHLRKLGLLSDHR